MWSHSAEPRLLTFHYLSLLTEEYASLLELATTRAKEAGFRLVAIPHGYDDLAKLAQIKALMEAPNTLVEMPLHTAALLMQDPDYAAHYKAVASPYTFTSRAAKIVLYHYANAPATGVSRLVCTAKNSIATQLFRHFALLNDWRVKDIDSSTVELADYDAVYRCAEAEAAKQPGGLEQTAYLVSGTRMVREMDDLLGRQKKGALKLRRVDNIYNFVKDSWCESLGELRAELHGDLPDLPGTIVIAREPSTAVPFFQPLIDAISSWNPDGKQSAAMGSPHIGTPTSVVAVVVYMELLAREVARHGLPPLPALDYAHFFLSDLAPHGRKDREEAVRAVQMGANWLFRTRRELAPTLSTYFRVSGADGATLAERLWDFDRAHLAQLSKQIDELSALAHQEGDLSTLRSKANDVFGSLVAAKAAFRLIEATTARGKPPQVADDRFHRFTLRAAGGNVQFRVRTDSWSADPKHRRRIDPLAKAKSLAARRRRDMILRVAVEIFRVGQVFNDRVNQLAESDFNLEQVALLLRDLRLLLPFVQFDRKEKRQHLDWEAARRVVHPDDLPHLEAMCLAETEAVARDSRVYPAPVYVPDRAALSGGETNGGA